ncbi:paired mesoderm homeobox protein 1-like [Acomys russatus]|uniref:paired mesoderm homeobox protein 1-like n=1 Tax=Acomys russatus TaxID=60746 RepID=UPI0021E2AB32|nr:paired mesoderm homeobox protein 1-like [Acomys russatus]
MALQPHPVDPNFYKGEEKEMEVSLDIEQEAATAADSGSSDKQKQQDIPDDSDDVIYVGVLSSIGNDSKDRSLGSHQGSGQPQLENQENVAAARDPQLQQRTRPRIQLGLTPRQLRELEEVFEKNKYPDEFIRKDLARRLYLGESTVLRWFKRRRAKDRKYQQSQVLKCASADSQST